MDDDALATLDSIIAKSLARAGEVVRHSFPPEERLTAAEVVEFWGDRRLAALATVSPARRAHALPLLVYLHRARRLPPGCPRGVGPPPRSRPCAGGRRCAGPAGPRGPSRRRPRRRRPGRGRAASADRAPP